MIQGIIPALMTPMNHDGSAIDTVAARELVEFLLGRGVNGFFVCGGTGEGLLLTAQERRTLLEAVVEQTAGRAAIIAHIGAMATQEAQALASHANGLGVDAVAAVPPVYFKVDHASLCEHYRLIAEAADETPIWVYQIPSATGVDITADVLSDLVEIAGVSGIKYSSYNLYDMSNMLTLPQEITILSGFDEVCVAALSMGAQGAVGSTYNVMPATFSLLYRQTQASEWDAARALQQEANRVIRALLTGPFVAGLKAILTDWGLPCGAPRRPLPPLSPSETREYLARIKASGLAEFEERSLAALG